MTNNTLNPSIDKYIEETLEGEKGLIKQTEKVLNSCAYTQEQINETASSCESLIFGAKNPNPIDDLLPEPEGDINSRAISLSTIFSEKNSKDSGGIDGAIATTLDMILKLEKDVMGGKETDQESIKNYYDELNYYVNKRNELYGYINEVKQFYEGKDIINISNPGNIEEQTFFDAGDLARLSEKESLINNAETYNDKDMKEVLGEDENIGLKGEISTFLKNPKSNYKTLDKKQLIKLNINYLSKLENHLMTKYDIINSKKAPKKPSKRQRSEHQRREKKIKEYNTDKKNSINYINANISTINELKQAKQVDSDLFNIEETTEHIKLTEELTTKEKSKQKSEGILSLIDSIVESIDEEINTITARQNTYSSELLGQYNTTLAKFKYNADNNIETNAEQKYQDYQVFMEKEAELFTKTNPAKLNNLKNHDAENLTISNGPLNSLKENGKNVLIKYKETLQNNINTLGNEINEIIPKINKEKEIMFDNTIKKIQKAKKNIEKDFDDKINEAQKDIDSQENLINQKQIEINNTESREDKAKLNKELNNLNAKLEKHQNTWLIKSKNKDNWQINYMIQERGTIIYKMKTQAENIYQKSIELSENGSKIIKKNALFYYNKENFTKKLEKPTKEEEISKLNTEILNLDNELNSTDGLKTKLKTESNKSVPNQQEMGRLAKLISTKNKELNEKKQKLNENETIKNNQSKEISELSDDYRKLKTKYEQIGRYVVQESLQVKYNDLERKHTISKKNYERYNLVYKALEEQAETYQSNIRELEIKNIELDKDIANIYKNMETTPDYENLVIQKQKQKKQNNNAISINKKDYNTVNVQTALNNVNNAYDDMIGYRLDKDTVYKKLEGTKQVTKTYTRKPMALQTAE